MITNSPKIEYNGSSKPFIFTNLEEYRDRESLRKMGQFIASEYPEFVDEHLDFFSILVPFQKLEEIVSIIHTTDIGITVKFKYETDISLSCVFSGSSISFYNHESMNKEGIDPKGLYNTESISYLSNKLMSGVEGSAPKLREEVLKVHSLIDADISFEIISY